MDLPLKIGTRGSPLALKQTHMVIDALLLHYPDLQTQIVVIQTSGDWMPEQGEVRLPTKALYAKEIEEALLSNKIDIAVHSMKDMDSVLPNGLTIKHMLPREDVRDCVLFSNSLSYNSQIKSISDISKDMRVGTASVRRQYVVDGLLTNASFETIRGNVQTRIQKVRDGQVDLTLLAMAGLKRLGLGHEADLIIDADVMVPAAGQGAIGIEIRNGDADLSDMLDIISCPDTVQCVHAERAVLKELQGDCDMPIGVYARFDADSDVVERILRIDAHLFCDKTGRSIRENRQKYISSYDDVVTFGHEIGCVLKDWSHQ